MFAREEGGWLSKPGENTISLAVKVGICYLEHEIVSGTRVTLGCCFILQGSKRPAGLRINVNTYTLAPNEGLQIPLQLVTEREGFKNVSNSKVSKLDLILPISIHG